METEVDTFAKSALISFFDNKKDAARLLMDIDCRYRAEEIIYIFQSVSAVFYQIFIGIVSAYLFHILYQKHNDKKSQKQLEKKIQSIVKSYKNDLEFQIKRLEDKMSSRIDEDTELQKRFELYIEKAKLLNEDNVNNLIKILEAEFSKGPQKQKKHISQFRNKY